MLGRRRRHELVGGAHAPGDFDEQPELFTGEHIFPWMFEDYGALAPAREAADELAAHEWPRLYDPEVLAANEVPIAAAIYTEDLYVERALLRADGRERRPTCTPG